LGTVIYDKERNVFIWRSFKDHDDFLVLKGGRPGYGNFFLKSCDKNIFCKLILGGQAKLAKFHLELKILADVGLLGFPNVGKSLFINRVSNVSSKVGDYSFTTLYPVLGTLKFFNFNKILIADIPGIIEGSCLGVGLGFNFLKHLLKTKLLLHFIDIEKISCKRSLLKELVVLNNELKNYNLDLLNIKKWLIFNKSDLVNDFYL
jgi:GTP-binding protein